MSGPREDKVATAARADLARLERESQTLGSSALARATDHLAGKDAPDGDRIELWGRRIGRMLGAVVVVVLLWHVTVTYILR